MRRLHATARHGEYACRPSHWHPFRANPPRRQALATASRDEDPCIVQQRKESRRVAHGIIRFTSITDRCKCDAPVVEQIAMRFETRTCDPANHIRRSTCGVERFACALRIDRQRRRVADGMPHTRRAPRVSVAEQIQHDHAPARAQRRFGQHARAQRGNHDDRGRHDALRPWRATSAR